LVDQSLLRKVAEESHPDSNQRNQLQRFDWLSAALKVFVTEGIDEVRITRLAGDLNVTRGSFYWHFNSREDLVNALVEYWKEKNTRAIIQSFDNVNNFEDGICQFFETCIDTDRFDPRLDLAIREWARRSKKIRRALDLADQTRIEAITKYFNRFGFSMPNAFIRARVLYFAQIGFYALEVDELLEVRLGYTKDYFECFTGRIMSKNKQQQFIDSMQRKFGEKIS